jgi:hypothetical protein
MTYLRMKQSSPLKRTTSLQQKTPMKRTGFVRRSKEQITKSVGLKSRGPKMTPIRRAARGQDCQLQILGVCNGDPATTVLCHSNLLADGKGMGLKAPDTAACFGCHACHSVLDGRAPRPDGMSIDDLLELFAYARERTHAILRAEGLLKEDSQC